MTDALDKQLQMNRETAHALRDSGVQDGQALEVDALFFAADEASASALAGHLTAEGWRARTDSQRRGVLKKRTVWSVQGTRSVAAGDDAFDAMVTQLDALAEAHGADFDGWGAEVQD